MLCFPVYRRDSFPLPDWHREVSIVKIFAIPERCTFEVVLIFFSLSKLKER